VRRIFVHLEDITADIMTKNLSGEFFHNHDNKLLNGFKGKVKKVMIKRKGIKIIFT
jgi:hypothetical protein